MFQRDLLAEFVAAGEISTTKKCARKLIPGAEPTLFRKSQAAPSRSKVGSITGSRRKSLYLERKYMQGSSSREEMVSALVVHVSMKVVQLQVFCVSLPL